MMSRRVGGDPAVLNAFRHHREEHLAEAKGVLLNPLHVLNAFRHHREEHGRLLSPHPQGHPGAQRLSASPGGALVCTKSPYRSTLCSTPFGITGRSTHALAAEPAQPRAVLNAFRHHREEHMESSR